MHTPISAIRPPERDVAALKTVENTGLSGAEVLVVIPTLNEALHIETCIASLLNDDERMKSVQIVVADGGSADGTQAIVERLAQVHPNIRLLNNPKRLQAAAVNLAASLMGEGKSILVRCDAHALYPPHYVMRVANALVAHDVDSIVTPMDAVGDTCFQRANAHVVDTPLGSGGSAHRGGRVSKLVDHGHHAGFRMSSFRNLGGYDETFSHNEDAEYDRRLRASGGKIYLDAEIRMKYRPRATPGALARQYFNYGKGRARTLFKHKAWPRLRQLIPVLVVGVSAIALAAAPVWPWALIVPAAYLAILGGASLVFTVRMRSICGLLAGPAAAIMHASWAAGFVKQTLASLLAVA